MRLDEVIEAIRPFADERYPYALPVMVATRVISRIVHEYDNLPKKPEPSSAQPAVITVGIKDRHVVLVSSGTAEVEPSFLVWTAAQAREVAAKLLELARSLDGKG